MYRHSSNSSSPISILPLCKPATLSPLSLPPPVRTSRPRPVGKMRAAYITDQNSPFPVIRLGHVDRPDKSLLKPPQILIKVHAAIVKFRLSSKHKHGHFETRMLGREFTGIVEESKGKWKVGERVYGVVRGCCMEWVVVEDDCCWKMSEGLDMVEGCALVGAWMKKWEMEKREVDRDPEERDSAVGDAVRRIGGGVVVDYLGGFESMVGGGRHVKLGGEGKKEKEKADIGALLREMSNLVERDQFGVKGWKEVALEHIGRMGGRKERKQTSSRVVVRIV